MRAASRMRIREPRRCGGGGRVLFVVHHDPTDGPRIPPAARVDRAKAAGALRRNRLNGAARRFVQNSRHRRRFQSSRSRSSRSSNVTISPCVSRNLRVFRRLRAINFGAVVVHSTYARRWSGARSPASPPRRLVPPRRSREGTCAARTPTGSHACPAVAHTPPRRDARMCVPCDKEWPVRRRINRHASRVHRLEALLVTVIAALVVLLLLVRPDASPPPSPYCRSGLPLAGVYHSPRLEVKKRCAVASGVVTRVKFEEFDGDVHVDLRTEGGERLVVEVIPQDRAVVPIPDTGAQVTVVGPRTWYTQHDWHEIHPAWWISSGRIVPATAQEVARVESLLGDTHGEQEVNDD